MLTCVADVTVPVLGMEDDSLCTPVTNQVASAVPKIAPARSRRARELARSRSL